jgi:hypothetical protein
LLAIEHQRLADVLHRLRAEALADFAKPRFSLLALALRTHFDQLVTAKTDVDFIHDGFGQAVVADQHHRVQRMRFGAQGAALCCSELFVHGIPAEQSLS